MCVSVSFSEFRVYKILNTFPSCAALFMVSGIDSLSQM